MTVLCKVSSMHHCSSALLHAHAHQLLLFQFQAVKEQLTEHRNTILSYLRADGGNEPLGNGTTHQLHGGGKDSMSMLTLSDSERQPPMVTAADRQTQQQQPPPPPVAVDETRSGFALVVNGHSLVHALTPVEKDGLELLFLAVAEQCTGEWVARPEGEKDKEERGNVSPVGSRRHVPLTLLFALLRSTFITLLTPQSVPVLALQL